MAIYDLSTVFDRLVAMQQEAVAGSDAASYAPYTQEGFPYWFNMLRSVVFDMTWAGDIDVDMYEIEMGLVVAHISEGYRGEKFAASLDHIDAVLDYFDAHTDLTTTSAATPTAYTSALDWLAPTTGAVITGIPGGLQTVRPFGEDRMAQLYIGFILTVPLLRERY